MRGFMLAGEEEFLEPYVAGKAAFFDNILELQETVSDNPPQVAKLGEAQTLIRDWIEQVVEPGFVLRRNVIEGNAQLSEIDAYVSEKRGKPVL